MPPSQRDYYRVEQDEAFTTPLDIVRTLPDDVLQLTTWCRYNPPCWADINGLTHARTPDKSLGGLGSVGFHGQPIDLVAAGHAPPKAVVGA